MQSWLSYLTSCKFRPITLLPNYSSAFLCSANGGCISEAVVTVS